MSWFYFAIITVFLTSGVNILRRVLMKDEKTDAIASSVIFQFLGGIIIAIIAIVHGFHMPPITRYPFNFFLQAVLWGLAGICQFKAAKLIEASEITIVSTLSSVITIVSAVLLLGEQFNELKVIGTLLILSAVVYLSHQSKKIRFSRGIFYTLGYCLFGGLGLTNDAFLIKHAETFSYLVIGFFTPGIFMLLIRPQTISKLSSFLQKKRLTKMIIFTLIYVTATITYFLALQFGAHISQMSPINQSSVILTILLAAVFLNEKDHLVKKIVCGVIVVIGVILLR